MTPTTLMPSILPIHRLTRSGALVFTVVCAVVCAPAAWAQTAAIPGDKPAASADAPVFTLADLIRAVVNNNPSLLASQRSREASAAAVTTAGAWVNPRVEMNAGSNRARLPSASGGAVMSWAVSQYIENPAVREARVSGARFGERSSAYQIVANTNELVAQVRYKAFEYLLRQEEAKAAAEALGLLEQIRNRVKVRVESGEAARYEIIKADAEIINARQKVQTAYLQIDQAALGINRMAAGALPARWTLAATLSDVQEVTPLEETKLSASQNNPELKSLQAELAKREAAVTENRAGRWPGIELRYTQARDPEIRQGMIGASIQIPLFDQRLGPLAQASAEQDRARALLDGRRAELTQQVLLAWKAMEIARVRVTALSTGAVREAEAALRVAEAAYRYGERGILDVLDAQRLLRTVRADLLDARFQVQAANVDLDYLAGRYADAYSPAALTLAP